MVTQNYVALLTPYTHTIPKASKTTINWYDQSLGQDSLPTCTSKWAATNCSQNTTTVLNLNTITL